MRWFKPSRSSFQPKSPRRSASFDSDDESLAKLSQALSSRGELRGVVTCATAKSWSGCGPCKKNMLQLVQRTYPACIAAPSASNFMEYFSTANGFSNFSEPFVNCSSMVRISSCLIMTSIPVFQDVGWC